MNFAFLVCIIAVVAAFAMKNWENPLYRKAVEKVKVEDGFLQEGGAPLLGTMPPKARCTLEGSHDYACLSTEGRSPAQYPKYLWGVPGSKNNTHTKGAQECAEACGKIGPGICVWKENGPEFGGGTTCQFISPEICSNSSVAAIEPGTYLPSQIKAMQSGRCL